MKNILLQQLIDVSIDSATKEIPLAVRALPNFGTANNSIETCEVGFFVNDQYQGSSLTDKFGLADFRINLSADKYLKLIPRQVSRLYSRPFRQCLHKLEVTARVPGYSNPGSLGYEVAQDSTMIHLTSGWVKNHPNDTTCKSDLRFSIRSSPSALRGADFELELIELNQFNDQKVRFIAHLGKMSTGKDGSSTLQAKPITYYLNAAGISSSSPISNHDWNNFGVRVHSHAYFFDETLRNFLPNGFANFQLIF